MKRLVFALVIGCGSPPPVEAPVVDVGHPAPAPQGSVDTSPTFNASPEVLAKSSNGVAQLTARAIVVSAPITFATGKDTLTPESAPALDGVGEIMTTNTALAVVIRVHTDDQGAETFNIALSQRRAESIAKALVARGVDASRAAAKGVGEAEPLVPNDTPANRAINRRIEFIRTDR